MKNQFNFIKEFVHVLVTQTEMFLDDVAGDDVYRRESLWLRLLKIVKYLRRNQLLQSDFSLYSFLQQGIIAGEIIYYCPRISVFYDLLLNFMMSFLMSYQKIDLPDFRTSQQFLDQYFSHKSSSSCDEDCLVLVKLADSSFLHC